MSSKTPVFREHALEFFQLNDQVADLQNQENELSKLTPELMKRAREKGVLRSGEIFSAEPRVVPGLSKREESARALLGSLAPPAPAPTTPVRDPIGEELARHSEKLAEIRCAINLVMAAPPGGGPSIWERERIRASRAYCEAVRPTYQRIASRYVAALIELGEVISLHSEFSYSMDRQGVAWASLRPLMMVAESPHVQSSKLHIALAWAIEAGWASTDAMPKKWLKPEDDSKAAAEHRSAVGLSVL